VALRKPLAYDSADDALRCSLGQTENDPEETIYLEELLRVNELAEENKGVTLRRSHALQSKRSSYCLVMLCYNDTGLI
jgi:hypothetical protein